MKWFTILLAALLLHPLVQDAEDDKPEQVKPKPAVAAHVDDIPIDVAQVKRELERSTRGRDIADAARPALEASALEKLVDRELALVYLAGTDHGAKKIQIDQLFDRLKQVLEARDIPVEKHLAEVGIRDLEQWRREAAWQIGWKNYRQKLLTAENLKKFFERNPQHYDGTQMRVAHILWKVKDEGQLVEKRKQAEAVRKQLESKELTFEAAAKKYSESPTAKGGGDIGWVDRRKTMPESFSKAAFDLKVGAISQPVTTQYGVHLILCKAMKPGQDQWEASREQLVDDVTRWLFNWAADQGRKKAKVRYTGAAPYWKIAADGSRSLQLPQ